MIDLQRIRWYNPKSESFEWREVPKSDEDALSLLNSSAYTHSCTDTYRYWRKLDATITAALLRAGEQAIEERSKQALL
jgi:hypothetical protein